MDRSHKIVNDVFNLKAAILKTQVIVPAILHDEQLPNSGPTNHISTHNTVKLGYSDVTCPTNQ